MLHEILVALYGYEGAKFIRKDDKIKIGSGTTFLHPSEAAIIEQLLEYGEMYRKIKNFCDAYNGLSIYSNTQTGLYMASLATCIQNSCKSYEDVLLSLEQELLKNPCLPLSYLLVSLQPVIPLISSFENLINEVVSSKIFGFKLLEIIYNVASLSVGPVHVLQKIEQSLHLVFYNQLSNWLLYGHLLDPHNELFIKIVQEEAHPDISSREESISKNKSHTDNKEMAKHAVSVRLRPEMLPSHIPLALVEKIIFIGETVLIYEEYEKKEKDLKFCGSMLDSKREEFLDSLKMLGEESAFNIERFSEVVESIRQCISEHLYIVVLDAGFLNVLSDVKSVFLLGRGELFQAFLRMASPLLNLPIVRSLSINGIFQQAGRQVLLDDGLLERFTLSLRLTSQEFSTEERGRSWKKLHFTFEADWPLYKIFGPSVQEKYNQIFLFLLDIRRAQYRLQDIWILQMQEKKMAKYSQIKWTPRHHMSFIIDNLQYYLQVDVLESHYWQLINKINSTTDYQQLIIFHDQFVSTISTHCFLANSLISNTVELILQNVYLYCNTVESLKPTDEKGIYKIKEISENFDRAAGKLFWILSTLRQHQGSQFTSQLVIRIDYNKYYSSMTSVRRFLDPLSF